MQNNSLNSEHMPSQLSLHHILKSIPFSFLLTMFSRTSHWVTFVRNLYLQNIIISNQYNLCRSIYFSVHYHYCEKYKKSRTQIKRSELTTFFSLFELESNIYSSCNDVCLYSEQYSWTVLWITHFQVPLFQREGWGQYRIWSSSD